MPTLDDVLQRLDLISTDITYSIRQYESQLSDTQKGMMDLKVTAEDLDREIQHGSQRFDYFQSLSNTVNDLGEFLDVKVRQKKMNFCFCADEGHGGSPFFNFLFFA